MCPASALSFRHPPFVLATSARGLAALALAAALAACQDPSGVGLGLIDDETSDPNAVRVEAATVDLRSGPEVTYGFARGGGTPVQTRALLGDVRDAQFGDGRAIAYLDLRKGTLPADFEDDRTVEQAELRLVRASIYGDTTATLPVELREVTASWSPISLPIDTTLATGEVLDTYSVSVGDSVAVLPLPAAFVADRDTLFRGSFDTAFEGFELRVPEGAAAGPGAVVGINALSSVLRLISDEYDDDGEATRDTVDYPIVEVFSSLRRAPATVATPDRVLLRDGDTTAVALTFDFAAIEGRPLANGSLRFRVDRSLVSDEGSFVRPLLTDVGLFGILDDATRVFLSEIEIGDGDIVTLQSAFLTAAIQARLLGRQPYERFELVPAPDPLSFGILPISIGGADEVARPRLSLVVVGG